jgi:cyclopropane-fatty-acyl-phospholipid synthase
MRATPAGVPTPDVTVRPAEGETTGVVLAQAYVTGEIDVEGHLADGLARVWAIIRGRKLTATGLPAALMARAAATALRLGVIGPRPAAPASQARLSGRLHSRRRDRAAIAHHYDLSNDCYVLVLDPQMAYSCAYWTSDDPGYSLEHAQRDKLDLVCRKLGLAPGQRFLHVGCGWGSLSLHYGVSVVGYVAGGC